MADSNQNPNTDPLEENNIKVRVRAETKDAVKSIQELERQLERLSSLADQGENRQEGFLSSKQVEMYRNIVQEMERSIDKRISKLEQLQSDFNGTSQDIYDDAEHRAKMYERATGGDPFPNDPNLANPYGDVADQAVIDRLEKEMEDAIDLANELVELESEIDALRDVVHDLEVIRQRGENQQDRIDQLYQRNPDQQRLIQGIVDGVTASSAALSIGGYMGYTGQGVQMLRQDEAQAHLLSMKAYGGAINDEAVHDQATDVGMKNQYTASETMQIQGHLMTGGVTSKGGLLKDVESTQEFSRAYGTTGFGMSNMAGMMQRMGAMEEGQMQRLADLIGGSIEKTNMRGREEELIQATSQLIQATSQGRTNVTQGNLDTVVALQNMLGNADPSLKGQRGANMLLNMDQAIKGGGNNIDLLMGKGTKYQGPDELWQLELMKEKGISDADNLKTIFGNLDQMFADESVKKHAFMENFGTTASQTDVIFEKIKPMIQSMSDKQIKDYVKQIQKTGDVKIDERLKNREDASTYERQGIQADSENLQKDHVQWYEEIATQARELMHGLPDGLQHFLMPAGALGVGLAGGSVMRRAIGKFTGNRIGGGGGSGGLLSRAWGGMKSLGGKAWDGMKSLGGKIPFGAMGKGLSKLLPFGLGAGATVGMERLENPEESWGRSIAKGTGSLLGGLAGGALAIGSGFFTGGAGWLGTGAAAVGGGLAGEKVGAGLYDFFTGGNKQSSSSPVPQSVDTQANSIDVKNLNVNDKSLARILEDGFKSSSQSSSTTHKSERNINIKISGKIDGMSKENENEVTSALSYYFSSVFGNGNDDVQLDTDQVRT